MKPGKFRLIKCVIGSSILILLAAAVGRTQGKVPAKIDFSDMTLVHDLALGASENDPITFKNPAGVAVDRERRIYVADPGSKCIEVFAPDGRHLETIGGKERDDLRLNAPISLCFDEQEVLYVFDFARSARNIVAISPKRKILRSFSLRFPATKIMASGESILVCSRVSDYNIRKFSNEGALTAEIDYVSGMEEEKAATSVAADRDGDLYLARKSLPFIKRLAPDGRELSTFEYNPTIANRQPPNQVKISVERSGNAANFRNEGMEYPVCYDIAVDSHGFQYLLVARDHAQSELCALWRIDPENKKVESAPLPFWCSRIFIDQFDQFYFFGSSDAPYVNRCCVERRLP